MVLVKDFDINKLYYRCYMCKVGKPKKDFVNGKYWQPCKKCVKKLRNMKT